MDQAQSKGSGEELELVHEGVSIDAVDGSSLDNRTGISGEVAEDSGSNKDVKGQEKLDKENISHELPVVDQGASYNSNNLVNQEVLETVVVIEPEYIDGDNGKLEAKGDQSGLSLVSVKAPNNGASETSENSCVINLKCSAGKGFCENSEGERICRICHLATGQPSDATTAGTTSIAKTADLIQLGCACKEELGIAHIHCAEAWFKLKGNRLCEICGETVKNVSGVANNGFMEEWNGRRFMDNDGNSSRNFCGCFRGQPFCNFLMACLVIAFVLPWFFRVNMF